MKKKISFLLLIVLVCSVFIIVSTGCNSSNWKDKFDTSLPDLTDSKWQNTMDVDFAKIKDMQELYQAGWAPSTHSKRKYEYWCDQMVNFSDKGVVIKSERKSNHICDICDKSEGVFTSGIETRPVVREDKVGNDKNVGFTQAFGYFEATVIVPRGSGMWSAFWLQSDATPQVGNGGKDGCEVDVYESSFCHTNPTYTGQAIHYDAYDAPWYKMTDNVTKMPYNLYDGKAHKYALLWTPDRYVVYVDDTPVWATNFGGVSQTAEFLRLTVEIRDAVYGPYGQKIGIFENHLDDTNDFIIQSVRVYQNSDYVDSIKSISDFKDMKGLFTALTIVGCIIGAIVIGISILLIIKFKKNKKV